MEQKENIADESKRLAKLNLDPNHIDFSLDQVIGEFGRNYMAELFKYSPYKEEQMEAVAAGDLDRDERLSFAADGWTVEALIYKTHPLVDGLLTETAKECLKNDFMAPPQLVEIFDQSREGYTKAAEKFNKAVETASPEKISESFHSLFDHAARYEFKKLKQNKITQKQIAATLHPRKAPMLSEETHVQPPTKIREAPMLPQQSTAITDTDNARKSGYSR